MVKYRRLFSDELEALEKEFVDFLCSNTITADDWIKIKETSLEKAELLIDMFSDIVMEKVLSKVKYIEFRSESTIVLIKCLDESIELINLQVNNESINLLDAIQIEQLLVSNAVKDDLLSAFKVNKPYAKSRNEEVFEYTKQGFMVSDGKLYEMVNTFLKS